MANSHLTTNVPGGDPLGFGQGDAFNPKAVADWLGLTIRDVSRIANVPIGSVQWSGQIPEAVRTHMEKVAVTCNLVADAFDGASEKTSLWFKIKNPLLGDIAPRDTVRLGRLDRLHKLIVSALDAQLPTH